MGNQRVIRHASTLIVMILAAFVLAACGGEDGSRPTSASGESTSVDRGSSPGQTPKSAGSAADPAVTDEGDGSPLGDDEIDRNSADGGNDDDPPTVDLGSSILVGKDFVNIAGRKVGVIASTASVGPEGHIVDVLNAEPDVDVVAVFSPEHGFRADQPSGAEVADEVDPATGLPIYSLYGGTYKPTRKMLQGIDVLIYDLQDVGTRYYTYISTLGLVMQAAAERGIEVVVLDRPNPAGGQLLGGASAVGNTSFVSQYPLPSIYGLTSGELAKMILGEGWLEGLDGLDLTVVPMRGWGREFLWADTGLPWIPPSPGLRTVQSARIYPSLVLFEATTISYGQGTDQPFTQIGAPWLDAERLSADLNALGLADVAFTPTTFTPRSTPTAPEPRYVDQALPGVGIEVTGPDYAPSLVGLHLLHATQQQSSDLIVDRRQMFDLLAGNSEIRRQLRDGIPPEQILESWKDDLKGFEQLRAPYLMYS